MNTLTIDTIDSRTLAHVRASQVPRRISKRRKVRSVFQVYQETWTYRMSKVHLVFAILSRQRHFFENRFRRGASRPNLYSSLISAYQETNQCIGKKTSISISSWRIVVMLDRSRSKTRKRTVASTEKSSKSSNSSSEEAKI